MQTVQFDCRKCKKVTKQVIHKITDLLPEGVETIQCSVCTFMTVANIGVDNEQLSTRVIHMGAKSVGLAQDQAQFLTGLLPSTLAGEPLKRLARWRSLVVLGVLCVMGMTPANGSQNNVDHLKIYAHVKLVSYKEFQCFNAIMLLSTMWICVLPTGVTYVSTIGALLLAVPIHMPSLNTKTTTLYAW